MVPTIQAPLLRSVGRVGGLVALILLPLGLLTVLINHRRIRGQRAELLTVVARTAVLKTELASVYAGYGQLVTPGAAAHGTPRPGDAWFAGAAPLPTERSRSRRAWAHVAIGLALVTAGVAAGVYLTFDSGAPGHVSEPRIEPPPTAAVAVLKAGSTVHAAHRLAIYLARDRVHVVGIGNLGAAAPAAFEVQYTPGDATQARLLAGLLKAQHPRVAPIDPAAAQAAGTEPRLIVVIP